MRKLLLLSHSHRDTDLAREVARLIEKVSLNQLTVWYSSDERSDRGLLPGDRWAERVRGKLEKCGAVVALVTPHSIGRPWLYFESGFGAAVADLEVIPICIHVDLKEVAPPLGMYQGYDLSRESEVGGFLRKLLAHYEIGWEQSMADVVIDPALQRILELSSQKFDVGYEIEIILPSEPHDSVVIKLSRESTIQDLLDEVYYSLPEDIPPHSYLEAWILREETSGLLLVVRGLSATVSARSLFRRRAMWRVDLLDKPYDPTSDRGAIRKLYATTHYSGKRQAP